MRYAPLVLFALTAGLSLCSCSSKSVVIKDCKPVPVDDCNPPDCYGGGIECSWDIVSNFDGPVPEATTSSDRFMGAIVVTQGEAVRIPGLEFKGSVIPTDDLLTDPQKTVLRGELVSRNLFDPNTQTIAFFRTTSSVPIDDGSGHIVIQVEKLTGSITGCGTLESDVNDGLPLDKLQVFSRHVDMPIAMAGGPYTAECAGGQTSVRLDGTGSRATMGGTLSYSWSSHCPGASFDDATNPTPTLTIDTSCGCEQSCDVQLILTEGVLSSASSAVVKITDATGPQIVVGPSPVLWPPNGTYRTFGVSDLLTSVADGCDASVGPSSVTITSVTSDEPEDAAGLGDGGTSSDIVVECPSTVRLRAERDAGGNGRVYSITYAVSDEVGNKSTAVARVSVPHNRPGPAANDDGVAYAVTGCALQAVKPLGTAAALQSAPDGPTRAGNRPEPLGQSKSGETRVPRVLTVMRMSVTEVNVAFALPSDGHVQLAVFDVAGRKLATLEDADLPRGTYQRLWSMGGIANGVYFVRMLANGQRLTRTVIKGR